MAGFTYSGLKTAVQNYLDNDETTFTNTLDTFIQQTEERILKSVQLPVFRKNSTGSGSSGNSYLVYNSLWGSSNSTRYTWVDLAPNSGSVSNVGESGIVYANNSTYHLTVTAEL